jgi:MFS family permease
LSQNRPGLRNILVALEHRDYRLLFFAGVASTLGGGLQGLTNTWQIFLLTGSPLQIGLSGAARAVPILLFSLIGGVIADRFDRRRIIVVSQVMNALFALLLGLLTAAGLVQVWHIYAVTFLNASLMSISQPGRRAIIASVVPRHHLMNAFALNQNLFNLSRIIAPALAGLMIATVALPINYFVNGAATLVTALWLTFIKVPPLPERPKASPLHDFMEGLAFVRRRSIILALLATDLGAMVFGSFQTVLPIFADRFDTGAAGYGVLESAVAIGATIGTASILSLGDIPYKGYIIVGSILAYCVCLVGLALSSWFWLTWVMVLALGLTDAVQTTPRNAVIQLVTPDELRGRVSSFQSMVVNAGPGVGLALMGAAASVFTAPVSLIVGAATCAGINMGVILNRRDLRAADLAMEPPEPAQVTPA